MAESRLAEIYRKELKTKGLLGALVSASGARMKEKTDIRNILPQTGISGAAFEKMFGKKYRYGGNGNSVRSAGDGGGGSGVDTKPMEEKLTRIGVDMKIMAKNTFVLPAMARDMNLMRMNMQKMVKLSGGTASTKADMFFKRAGDRENQYESQYKKNSSLTPTSENTESQKGGGFGIIGSLLSGILSGLKSLFSMTLGPLLIQMLSLLLKGGLILGVITAIGKYFTDPTFAAAVNKVVTDLWNGITPEFKKQLLVGGSILLGAIAAWKISMFGLGLAMDALRLKILGIGGPGGIDIPGSPGSRGPGGRSAGRSKMGMLGKLGLYGMGAFGLYQAGKSLFGDPMAAEYEGGATYEGSNGSTEMEGQKSVGLNTDTALAVGGTALGAYGLASAGSSIKKSLTPTPTPGFLTEGGTLGRDQAARRTKWGRFLAFLERKAPRLFARLGIKLMSMAGLAAIPIAGWVSALFTLAFAISDIYAIYTLWSEFTNSNEETSNPEVNDAAAKATKVSNETSNRSLSTNPMGDNSGYVTVGNDSPTPSSASSGSTSLSNVELPKGGSISASESIDYLVKNGGLTPEQAAGVVGNLVQESRLNSGAHNKSEGAYGLAQWRLSRLADLTTFAAGKGKDIGDPKTQLDFLIHELKGKEKRAGQMLASSNTVEEAAFNFGKYYERPKTVETSRMQYASKALAEYKPTSGASMLASDSGGAFFGNPNITKQGAKSGATQVPSSPSTGNALAQAQGNLTSQQLAMNSTGNQTVVNAPTNNNINQNSNNGGNVNPYNADLMKYLLTPIS